MARTRPGSWVVVNAATKTGSGKAAKNMGQKTILSHIYIYIYDSYVISVRQRNAVCTYAKIPRYVWINKNQQDEKTWVSVDVQQARAPPKKI